MFIHRLYIGTETYLKPGKTIYSFKQNLHDDFFKKTLEWEKIVSALRGSVPPFQAVAV